MDFRNNFVFFWNILSGTFSLSAPLEMEILNILYVLEMGILFPIWEY